MKLNTLTKLMKWSAVSLACAATSLVGVPEDITYNGSLADDQGLLLDGKYYMKVVIADSAATAPGYWNNEEGNAPTVLVPATPIEVDVVQGIFSVVLEGVDSSVLANPDANLWVFVSDAEDGTFEALGADPLSSVPYAVRAGTAEEAESVAADDIQGEIEGSQLADGTITVDQIADGSIDEDKLGNITISLPNIDGNGNGIPGEPEDEEVSMASIMRSISENSVVTFGDLPGRTNMEIFLREDIPVGVGASGVFKDPFPVAHAYETNAGLIPYLSIVDDSGVDITGQANNPINGLTFSNVMEDIDGDGNLEPRMQVTGTPADEGTTTINVRATNRWGESFIVSYTVIVTDVDIAASQRVRGYSTSLASGSRAASTGGNNIPEVGGDDADFDVYGGDPTWFRFFTDEALEDHIVVRWTVPNGTGGTAQFLIAGEAGRTFFVNAPGGTAPLGDGLGSSQGAIELDENPWEADVSHEGVYAAAIQFDWGQSLDVGADRLDNIQEGFVLPENTIRYGSGAGVNNLFDKFTDTDTVSLGNETIAGQFFGTTPQPDSAFGLANTAEAGEIDKYLVGEDPFDVISNQGTAGTAYIRGTATTSWLQQKVQRIDTISGTTYQERGVNIVDQDNNTGNVFEADPRLNMTGFGPLDGSGALLGSSFPALNQGLISDDNFKRGSYSYPEDGSPLTFGMTAPMRPIINAVDDATVVVAQEKQYYLSNGILIVTYWVHVTNGFIDQIAPITCIFEVGDNINIVNDLIPRSQVAGYSQVVGGDFGTTNGRFFPGLYPDQISQPSNKVVWGVNNVAYVWNSIGGGSGFSVSPNGNSLTIPSTSMVNVNTPNDGTVDFSYDLDVDSGYSSEGTSADIFVRSDIVIYDFYVQEIDLTLDRNDPGFIVAGDDTTQDITIDQGDDLMITLQAYVRPALFNAADDGGITLGLLRAVDSEFFLVPTPTGTPVQLTNDVTKIVDDVVGINADAVNVNHVPNPIDQRVLVTWEVILENPLQAIGATNVATGYVKAIVSSSVGGVEVNSVSTDVFDSNSIAPYANGQDAVDGVLDTMVAMPLNNTIVGPTGGLTITVNP